MAIEESLVVRGVLEGLKSGTRDGYITTLERFVNEFTTDMTVEELVEVFLRQNGNRIPCQS